MKTNQARFILRAIIIEEPLRWHYTEPGAGENFVGICDELGITAEAEDRQQLEAVAGEATDLLFESLAKHGDAADFLTKREIAFRIEERIVGERIVAKGDDRHSFTLFPRFIPIQHSAATL